MDLFDYHAQKAADSGRPLAERMRPRSLDEFIGQSHVVGEGTLIRNAIEQDRIFSMILWGPPGCGKTTLARIIATETRSYFVHCCPGSKKSGPLSRRLKISKSFIENERFFSSMKSIVSTKPSRMRFCITWKTV